MTYQVLIVDDEENIRKGIAENCSWEQYGVRQVYTAGNGEEAMEIIGRSHPELVITDVKMPVMDGLTLIRKAAARYPDILFAVLSGYEDFEFARTALQQHAIDYLLKPCSIEAIHELLCKAATRLEADREKKEFTKRILEEYHRLETRLQEQALKDYIINPSAGEAEFADAPSFRDASLRLLLLHVDEPDQSVQTFSLMQIGRELLQKTHRVYLCTLCNNQVLTVLEYLPFPKLRETLLQIRDTFLQCYGRSVTFAVGERTSLDRVKESYRSLQTYLHSQFFIGNGNIITTYDLPSISKPLAIRSFQTEYLELAMKRGNGGELDKILEQLFAQLNDSQYDVNQIRAFSAQIYLTVIRQAREQDYMRYLDKLEQINSCPTLSSLHGILSATAHAIMTDMYENVRKTTHELIRKILYMIDDYLADERLSLSFVANELLYVNVDYLGKLFKAETGEKFSKYVTDKRIERAKKLFLGQPGISVKEVARLTGFGYNAQYFSKVFKSCTGYTPKEYHSKF